VESTLPDASMARAWKVCAPSGSPLYCFGEVHAAKTSPSRLHTKLELASVEEIAKVADELDSVPDGPLSMAVSGEVLSPGVTVTTSCGACELSSRAE
jgi:hypothetical protein